MVNQAPLRSKPVLSLPRLRETLGEIDDYFYNILGAHEVYDLARQTDLHVASKLSFATGSKMLLKREDTQPIFSFKIRGAYLKMARLTSAQRNCGVICASAGNHAQGVALSAKHLGCRAVIVMPVTTPAVKVEAVKAFGGEVVLFGESYSDAFAHAEELQTQHGYTFVHAFDDVDVITGQGTVGVEILSQHAGHIDAIFVPVGGGGLIAGISAYVKAERPRTKIIGVQALGSDAMSQSVRHNRQITLAEVNTFSDGTAVKKVGKETLRLVSQYVDGFVVVNEDNISAAIRDIYNETRTVVEPAGALAVAGMKLFATQNGVGRTYVSVVSGANMDFNRLRDVSERADIGTHTEALLGVTIPERRGSFKDLCHRLEGHDITKFSYRVSDPKEAHIFVGLSVLSQSGGDTIVSSLIEGGLTAINLTDNELAKSHLAHGTGGRSDLSASEHVFTVAFPERRGALMEFLSKMPASCNITLFQYNNLGSDTGSVLIGVQMPDGRKSSFIEFLDTIKYDFVDQTNNPAYSMFF